MPWLQPSNASGRSPPLEARAWLAEAPGVRVVDDATRNHFPMPSDVGGRDEVLVGRFRREVSNPSSRALALFAVGDQLRKCAALNEVQIAERLLPKFAGQHRKDSAMTIRSGLWLPIVTAFHDGRLISPDTNDGGIATTEVLPRCAISIATISSASSRSRARGRRL